MSIVPIHQVFYCFLEPKTIGGLVWLIRSKDDFHYAFWKSHFKWKLHWKFQVILKSLSKVLAMYINYMRFLCSSIQYNYTICNNTSRCVGLTSVYYLILSFQSVIFYHYTPFKLAKRLIKVHCPHETKFSIVFLSQKQ